MLGRSLEHVRVGGIVYVSRQLLAHLDTERFDVCYFANGAGHGNALGGAVRITTFPIDLVRAWRQQTDFRPDVIHINTSLEWRSLLRDSCFLLLLRARCEHIVLFIHGWRWELGRRLQSRHHPLRWFCGLIFRLARRVVLLSSSFADVLQDVGIARDRIYVVSNPVDCSAFPRPAAATRPNDGNKWRLLFMARFVEEKGIYELIDAMPRLLDACERPVELILAGDGPERDGAERRCRDLGIDQAVVFPGYVTATEKQHLFESAHIFVFPTRSGEGLPIVLLEAMAAGLPLVVTRAGGIGDFVRDKEHGVMLSGTSATDIASAVLALLGDSRRLAEIGRGNREYARDNFDSLRIARRLEAIYLS
jgi:glycosyltransferase involved in cell wall biosynthesis